MRRCELPDRCEGWYRAGKRPWRAGRRVSEERLAAMQSKRMVVLTGMQDMQLAFAGSQMAVRALQKGVLLKRSTERPMQPKHPVEKPGRIGSHSTITGETRTGHRR